MNDLLSYTLEAHGGLSRWRTVESVSARIDVGGLLFEWKGVAGAFRGKKAVADARRQRLVVEEIGGGNLVYTPEMVWIEDGAGRVLDQRPDPARAFEGHVQETRWDLFHAAVFNGRALWTYLTQPFLYVEPGFEVEEVEPLQEDGEVWRSLRVTFPKAVASHTRTQITRIGPDGLIRRHDYTVDLLGGASGMNYASAYQNVDGIMVPTRRRVYPRDAPPPDGPLLVSLDLSDVVLDHWEDGSQ
ncbi:hypothetical protein E2F50_03600 [Rhizobium deserti]|uniref:DUF3386 family protein n=1 Tax=Rhizobium deserti TaxID=2547961 RepID=A0A4V3APV5_9HYPH|nr:hypothetical protein [Rhizobium deserti]TDK39220.1 hypothetical protein E2F50_03600 [Rhizobium deserti]